MTRAASAFSGVEVVGVPVQYPMGSERHLVQAITGRETPAKKLTADLGVVVHNVATARAVHHAVRFGRPLISRVVTVSGKAVREPNNIEAPIGARVSDLIAFCGGFATAPESLVNGGPTDGSTAAQPGRAGGQGHVGHPGAHRRRDQPATGQHLHPLWRLRDNLPVRAGAA